jgi:hypothetical protein
LADLARRHQAARFSGRQSLARPQEDVSTRDKPLAKGAWQRRGESPRLERGVLPLAERLLVGELDCDLRARAQLPDDDPMVGTVNDLLDLRLLVSGGEHELGWIATDPLVLAVRDRQPISARGIEALADILAHFVVCTEVSIYLFDVLVDHAEERLVSGGPLLLQISAHTDPLGHAVVRGKS